MLPAARQTAARRRFPQAPKGVSYYRKPFEFLSLGERLNSKLIRVHGLCGRWPPA